MSTELWGQYLLCAVSSITFTFNVRYRSGKSYKHRILSAISLDAAFAIVKMT